jgi:DNA-binding transcriptional regulator YdaS (Cro superfamily)
MHRSSVVQAILEWKRKRNELGSVKQLAHRLGVSEATIYQVICRARKRK